MQLHELIDKCVTWIAYDGILESIVRCPLFAGSTKSVVEVVHFTCLQPESRAEIAQQRIATARSVAEAIGTEPLALHNYIRKLDASVDDAYFAYLYSVLVEHPSVRVALTTEPLAGPDKTVRLGDAPLPDDFQIPEAIRKDVNISDMLVSGIKGRAMAYHLSGEEYKSNRQVIEEKRVKQQANLRLAQSSALRRQHDKQNRQPKPDPEDGLIRDLVTDDGQGIPKEDLNGLAQRWGSRLRLRCTDEEIYTRLTGSHQKNSKITPIVFHTLSHAAKSREKGITAIELGPLVGSSQGSMHHYMKTLTTLGLCKKVPTTIHAAITNLLVFHAFLDENPNYRSLKYGYSAANAEPEKEDVEVAAVDSDGEVAVTSGPATASDWGLQFPDLTESDMMNDLVIRERLAKLLDHPSLSNHLLRAKNLLPLLGWKAETALRHRRAAPRIIRSMVETGQIEYVDVGARAVRCIRLTKYNPDRAAQSTSGSVVRKAKTAVSRLHDPDKLVRRHSHPLQVRGGCAMFQSVVFQIGAAIMASGSEGMRIPDLRDTIFGLYRRMVEFHFSRMEKMTRPPVHLQDKSIITVMESWGKERRLRAFSMTAYRDILTTSGQPLDETIHRPPPPEAGHFANVSHRAYYADATSYFKHMDSLGTPATGSAIVFKSKAAAAKAKAPPAPPKKRDRSQSQSTPAPGTPGPEEAGGTEAPDWSLAMPKTKRDPQVQKYDSTTQVRGRPRKYVHVVDPDGKVDRTILGQILPHPDLATIYIYLRDIQKLVPAPDGYTGLGVPPILTEEDIKGGLAPQAFIDYPRAKGSKIPVMLRKRKLDTASAPAVKNPPKKRKAEAAPAPDNDAESGDDQSKTTRRSKRAQKPVPVPVPEPEREVYELLDSDHEDDKMDEGQEEAPQITEAANIAVPRDVEMDHASPQPHEDSTIDVDPGLDDLTAQVDPRLEDSRSSLRPTSDQAESSMMRMPAPQAQDQTSSESPAVNRFTSAPHTPAHVHQELSQPVYTPPGFHHFTILPPVVYVPPGHTVWPPLPPGYPTTDIPPPGYQPSPVPVVPAASGFWKHQPPTQSPLATPSHSRIPTQIASPAKERPLSRLKEPTEPSPVVRQTRDSPQQPPAISVPPPSVPTPAPTAGSAPSRHKPRRPSPLNEVTMTLDDAPEPDHRSSTPEAEVVETPSGIQPSPAQRPEFEPQPTGHLETMMADMAQEVEGLRAARVASASPVKQDLVPVRQVKTVKKGRVDLGPIRRANEMLAVLQQAGGVCEEHILWKRHQTWSREVAGTDVQFAPAKGATMDRTVWKRLIETTAEDGRTKNTTSLVPTATASWVKNRVIWLIDCPQTRIDDYMRDLANTTKKATAPKQLPGTKIPLVPYTEVKLPSLHPSSTVQYQLSTDIDAACRELSGEARRNELLKDATILSQLHGRQSGKWARTATFHREVRRALDSPRSQTVLDRPAGVFLAPLLSQDISVGAWYAVTLTYERDDRLMEWLDSPDNKLVPLRDIPFDVRTTKEGRRHRARTRIRTHVEVLLCLGLLSPLSFCDESEAYVTVDSPVLPNTHLRIDTKESTTDGAPTYVLHDYAPIYHIAGPSPVLLGYLPVRTEDEIERFWDTYRMACLESDQSKLPEILPKSSIDSLNYARTPDTLKISGATSGSMRHLYGWKNEIKLLPVQREALNDAVNWALATTKYDTLEKQKALAWEYALPVRAVTEHIEQRLERAKAARDKRIKRDQEVKAARQTRQIKAQKALAAKLSERQAESKRIWENRVANICARLLVQFDNELLDHVSRQSLTSLSRGSLTNEIIERIIRQYMTTKMLQAVRDNAPPPSMPVQPIPIVQKRPPKDIVRQSRPFRKPGTRFRRKWTEADDELIIDAEAIIRARNNTLRNGRGRAAMEQLFPDVLTVTFTSRVKRAIATPTGEAYLDLLTDAWNQIWQKARGTDKLDDGDPTSNVAFDLQSHVDFLRKNIRKTELRVQATSMGDRAVPYKQEAQPDLPEAVGDLIGRCRWTYRPTKHFGFEILWHAHNSQEFRLGQIGSISLIKRELEPPQTRLNLSLGRLRAILKMIVATPPSQYDQTAAIALLRDYDQSKVVNPEIGKMVAEKILVKHNSASLTGRFYSFAQAWQTQAQGPFTGIFYEDAEKLESKISAPGGMEWPVIGSSGELAALMNMVSEHKVDFHMDPSSFPTIVADQGVMNTRRLNDVSFEFGFKTSKAASSRVSARVPSLYNAPVPRQWDSTTDATGADLVKVYERVRSSGPDGLRKPDLQALLGLSQAELQATLAAISTADSPPVFWAGYDTARLVHIDFWPVWQSTARKLKLSDTGVVMPGGEGEIKCAPRRWVDVWGRRIEDAWTQALSCARGWLVARPGMTERILRQKLSHVMDRLEMNEVLQYLLDKEVARRVYIDGRDEAVPPIEAVGVEEEGDVVWRPISGKILA